MIDFPESPEERLKLVTAFYQAFTHGTFDEVRGILGNAPRWFDEHLPRELCLGHPLNLAIQWSSIELVAALLDAGANPNAIDESGFTTLFMAIGGKRLDVVRLLLLHGADPNGRGIHNWTPLHQAVRWKDTAAVELLLAWGADPKLAYLTDVRSTPLDTARLYAFVDGIALLEAATQS
jgi:ankyrin repeat protein